MEASIHVQNLTKSYHGQPAVEKLNLTISPGELYGLVGPDGAGKTTAIRLICGVIKPDQGSVYIEGISLAEHPDRAREKTGYLSQQFSLYEDLSVLENIRFFAEVRGIPRREWHHRAVNILSFVGLVEFKDRKASHLSGGMKKKLGLAAALIHKPAVLLLDEPTCGVDPVTRQDFWQLLIHLVTEENTSVLVSTPYMDEASRCSRVGFLHNGAMLIENQPGDLQRSLGKRILEVRGKSRSRLQNLAERIPGVESVQSFGDHLHIRVEPGKHRSVARAYRKLARKEGVDLDTIQHTNPDLEDVFMEILESTP
jgi:ABC-2 type transport system ATP-binding protein